MQRTIPRHGQNRAKRNERRGIARIKPSASMAIVHPMCATRPRFVVHLVFLFTMFFLSAWKRMLVLCALRG